MGQREGRPLDGRTVGRSRLSRDWKHQPIIQSWDGISSRLSSPLPSLSSFLAWTPGGDDDSPGKMKIRLPIRSGRDINIGDHTLTGQPAEGSAPEWWWVHFPLWRWCRVPPLPQCPPKLRPGLPGSAMTQQRGLWNGIMEAPQPRRRTSMAAQYCAEQK